MRGQAAWGLTVAGAGILVAILAPALGAIADAAGPKKPWIAVFGVLLVSGGAALWFVQPGNPNAVQLAVVAVVVASVGSELSIVFHNALHPLLASRNRLGQLSGLGWASASGRRRRAASGAGFLAVDPRTGLTLGGWPPPFANPANGPPVDSWAAGCGFWFAIFVLPMFIWMPDDQRSERPLSQAASDGFPVCAATLRELRGDRTAEGFHF